MITNLITPFNMQTGLCYTILFSGTYWFNANGLLP